MQNHSIKTAIITGGTRGIGADITRAFHKNEWNVLIASRQDSGLADELEQVRFCQTDVRQEKDHLHLAEIALEWTGRLDCYINCAGFSKWSPIGEIDENFWDNMMDTNLKGTFWGCKTAAKYLSDQGTIINVSSLAGKRGSANNSVYCASKFGVNALTQALAKELGSKGIRVNAVCPVYVETEGVFSALEEPDAPPGGVDIPQFLANFAANNSALQRLPKGDEVAELCYFLASDNSSAITAQCINIDCGVMPQ